MFMKMVVVGVPTITDAEGEFRSCRSEFRKKGLFIRRASLNQALIDTANCRIVFIPKDSKYMQRGLKSDACFGFSKEYQCLFNKSRMPTDYNGTFLDYVYEVEGIKR